MPMSPEERAARAAARTKKQLEEIRAAGARAAASFPPLTAQQLDTIAALIHPTVAVPAPAATVPRRSQGHGAAVASLDEPDEE